MRREILLLLAAFVLLAQPRKSVAEENRPLETVGLRVAVFDMDVTPPVGTRLTYNVEKKKWDMGLRARGIVLLGAGKPIVLCSVDWIGIANEGYDSFREALAEGAGTIPERVDLHTVHQHDAPICDFSSEKILKKAGVPLLCYDGSYARDVLCRLKEVVGESLAGAREVTHVGIGEAKVYRVASNRRILGEDGKVKATRFTTCKDSVLRAEPEGLIDPVLTEVSFWDGDSPVAVLSYYAVHPQSYYRTGTANPDFPGIARFMRQLAEPEALHIHFNGAGGDVGAGKYNDGRKENRLVLAERLADGMKRAWETTRKVAVNPDSVTWSYIPVSLPPSQAIKEPGKWVKEADTIFLANNLFKTAWAGRLKEGRKIDITCLKIGRVRILGLPGEPFVSYQLSAKAERPDLTVAVAGYGDYAPGYIATPEAYSQGGYETSEASGVSPAAYDVLMDAIRKLLDK